MKRSTLKTFSMINALIITGALASTANAGTADKYYAADNTLESKLCVAVATMSKAQLNRKLDDTLHGKHSHLHYKQIANELNCNGMSASQFAKKAGNASVAEKLASFSKEKVTINDIAAAKQGFVATTGE